MKYYRNKKVIVGFLLPAMLFMTTFIFYPFVRSVIQSFYKTDGFMKSEFIGFNNYRQLLEDSTMHIAIENTFILMLYVIIFEVGLAIILAVLVDQISKGQGFFRVVFFFPIVISATAIGMMFKLFYVYEGGLINTVLLYFGLEPYPWLASMDFALELVAIPTVWQYIGFYFVIILAAIKQIPKELYEAAAIDGVTGFKRVTKITLPLVRNVINTALILAVTGTLKVFDMALVINEGGPLNRSMLMGLHMYNKAFSDERFGYAAAISVVIVVIGLITSLIVNRIFKSEDLTY